MTTSKSIGMVAQQPLGPQEMNRAIAAAKTIGAREYALVRLAANQALRASELAHVKVSDINLVERTLRVVPGKNSTKSLEAISDAVVEALSAWMAIKAVSPWLFPSPTNPNAPISRALVYNIFRAVAARAGLPTCSRSPHAYRHSCGQALADAGMPVQEIAKVLRHRSINSTMHYFKVKQSLVDAKKKAMLAW